MSKFILKRMIHILTGPGLYVTRMPVDGGGGVMRKRQASRPTFLRLMAKLYVLPSLRTPKSILSGTASRTR